MATPKTPRRRTSLDGEDSDVGILWLAYTRSVRECVVPNPEDRALDQLLPFRDKVFLLVQDEAFVNDLRTNFAGWAPEDFDNARSYELTKGALLEELRSFPRMMEVEKSAASTDTSGEGWRKRIPSLLGKASIINGSVKDLIGDSPNLKKGLTLLKELLDFFKGKG